MIDADICKIIGKITKLEFLVQRPRLWIWDFPTARLKCKHTMVAVLMLRGAPSRERGLPLVTPKDPGKSAGAVKCMKRDEKGGKK